jgi:hypothetical protein
MRDKQENRFVCSWFLCKVFIFVFAVLFFRSAREGGSASECHSSARAADCCSGQDRGRRRCERSVSLCLVFNGFQLFLFVLFATVFSVLCRWFSLCVVLCRFLCVVSYLISLVLCLVFNCFSLCYLQLFSLCYVDGFHSVSCLFSTVCTGGRIGLLLSSAAALAQQHGLGRRGVGGQSRLVSAGSKRQRTGEQIIYCCLREISRIGNFTGSHSVHRFAGAVEVSFGAGIDASSSGWRVCAHEGAASILQPCLADSARRSDTLGMKRRRKIRRRRIKKKEECLCLQIAQRKTDHPFCREISLLNEVDLIFKEIEEGRIISC